MSKRNLYVLLGVIASIFVAICLFFAANTARIPKDIVVNFSSHGNISKYQTNGFAGPESEFSWTDGKEANIVVPVSKMPENYTFVLSVDIKPFVSKSIKKQDVAVFVNDKNITKWTVNKDGIYTAFLPQSVLSDKLNIKFNVANPKSPKDLKISQDTRKLGIAIKNIKLSAVDAYNPEKFTEYKVGKQISFAYNGNSDEYIGSGWSAKEKRSRWTDGKDAYVNLFIKDIKDRNLQLLVSGRGLHAPEDSYQPITVYVNDKEVITWKASLEYDVYSVMLPESVLGTGALKIRLHTGKPFSPKSDPRQLGLFVKEIRIREPVGVKTKVKIALWLKNKVLKNVKGSSKESADDM